MDELTKRGIVAARLRATREPSVLLAFALIGACAHAPVRRPAEPGTGAPEPNATAVSETPDILVWPGATPRDLELAHEVLAATRHAVERLLPPLVPLGRIPVKLIVSDTIQPVGSAYLIATREIRLERRFVDRMNLAHEATHALLHGRLGAPPPVWFDEAVAQLAAYRVVHGEDLVPPPGRPVSDFADLRALHGASWAAAGGQAYGESARWLGYLLPSGPASAEEKAAFQAFVARLVGGDAADVAERELRVVDAHRR